MTASYNATTRLIWKIISCSLICLLLGSKVILTTILSIKFSIAELNNEQFDHPISRQTLFCDTVVVLNELKFASLLFLARLRFSTESHFKFTTSFRFLKQKIISGWSLMTTFVSKTSSSQSSPHNRGAPSGKGAE